MRIVTLLPTELLHSLTGALDATHLVHNATDAIELHRLIRSVDADLMILDPTVRDGQFSDAIETTVANFPWLPVVVYTPVSAKSMALVLRLAPLGLRHMVLYRIDDDPRSFLELIERVPADAVIDLMLRELQNALTLLPIAAQRAVELLFKSPSRARTSADLARHAGMTRRSLYRHAAAARLQPRLLIDCARLLRAYTILRTPGSRLKEASTKLGFARPETLSQLLHEWTGHTVRSIHQGVQPASFVRLLAETLLRSSHRSGDPEEAPQSVAKSV